MISAPYSPAPSRGPSLRLHLAYPTISHLTYPTISHLAYPMMSQGVDSL